MLYSAPITSPKDVVHGQVTDLFIKTGHGVAMQPVRSVMAVTNEGLVGDVSRGRSKRQLLLIERATLEAFQLEPGQVRENITVEGFSLAGLEPASRLQIGPVLIEITGECSPCSYMDQLRPGLQAEIDGQRGVLARVISGGRIQIGDRIRRPAPQ